VAGVALGFGAQRVVSDVLSGFFLFAERQYGFGDVIRISETGHTDGISGTVEGVTLRTTKLRTTGGELVFVPNGEIRQVANLSREWSRVVVDVPVPVDEDLARVSDVIERACAEMADDDRWRMLLLEPPTVVGVEDIEVGYMQLRLVCRTLPAKQWDVARELRRRATAAMRHAGVAAPKVAS
jgi:moderate conductance mechanosensitive channel